MSKKWHPSIKSCSFFHMKILQHQKKSSRILMDLWVNVWGCLEINTHMTWYDMIGVRMKTFIWSLCRECQSKVIESLSHFTSHLALHIYLSIIVTYDSINTSRCEFWRFMTSLPKKEIKYRRCWKKVPNNKKKSSEKKLQNHLKWNKVFDFLWLICHSISPLLFEMIFLWQTGR